ncbi:MAG: hypothetical protein MHMPM18_002850 [Marteilia pararefringens]
MTVRYLIDSPRRFVLLLALCTSLTNPQIYASDCCACDEKRGFSCPIKAVGNASVSQFNEFNGRHIPEEQDMILGYGEDYCINTMHGIGLVPHMKDENDESDGDGFFCKCKEGDYMAFFGMCIPKPFGKDPKENTVVDGIMFGKEDLARLLPPANDDGLDDYSFFAPYIEYRGTTVLLRSYNGCDPMKNSFDMKSYGGSSYDSVCFCAHGNYLNRMGKCVEECDNPIPSGRSGDESKYCEDY